MSTHPFARLVPERWRWAHRWFAHTALYAWQPCPLCKRPFGGHEWRDINGRTSCIPKPDSMWGSLGICPACTRAGRGIRRLPPCTNCVTVLTASHTATPGDFEAQLQRAVHQAIHRQVHVACHADDLDTARAVCRAWPDVNVFASKVISAGQIFVSTVTTENHQGE